MASFDMNQELEKARAALSAVEAYISQGDAQLRTAEGFGAGCTELALRLRETVVALPLREPPPELTRVEVPVAEHELRPAGWYDRWLRRGEVDVEGRVRARVERRRTLQVEDVRWPGRGEGPVTATVEATDYVKAPAGRGRAFRWAEHRVRREIAVSRELFPRDAASLKRVQEAYLRRKEELNRNAADVSGFIRRCGGAVAEQEQATARLRADAEELARRVAALPAPPDAAGEMLRMEQRIREILQGLETARGEAAAAEARLEALRGQVKALYPELNP